MFLLFRKLMQSHFSVGISEMNILKNLEGFIKNRVSIIQKDVLFFNHDDNTATTQQPKIHIQTSN